MDKNIIIGKGIIRFDPSNVTKKHNKQSSWKKTAMIIVDDDTCKYYQWFIERAYKLIQGKEGNLNWLNNPLRGPHVTIINDRISDECGMWDKLRDKYNNKEVYFFYDIKNGLRNNGEHIYYKVDCPFGDEIRRFGKLGDPYFGYHLTIGRISDDVVHRKNHIERVQQYMIEHQHE